MKEITPMNAAILVVCWLGVLQSTLLSLYFLSAGSKSTNQLLLGATLLMISLRAAKSTLFLFHSATPLWVLNVGFAAHAAIGPLLLLYVSTLGEPMRWTRRISLQFVPALVIIAGSPFLSLDSFWYPGGYAALLYLTLGYTVIYCIKLARFLRDQASQTNVEKFWITALIVVLTLFQLSYFSNYILKLTSYSTGPIIYAALIYVITFVVLKNNQAFLAERTRKYKHINLTQTEALDHFQKIRQIMETKSPYLQADFNLQKLSELSGLPAYLVSHAISTASGQNFNHFTNSYRIAVARQKLADARFDHLTIAGIAFDCGFSSLSSFNSSFKKETGTTPSHYKRNKFALAPDAQFPNKV